MTEQTIEALHDLTVQLVRNAQKTDDRFETFAQQIGTNLGSHGLAPVQPKIFKGTTNSDIFAFLAKFDRFAMFFAWDAPKRLQALPLFLEGHALCFYDTLPDTTRQHFGRLQTALQEHFSPLALRVLERTALNQRRMGDRETLDAYTEDINSKCRRLNLPDPDRMQIFIQGLTDDLKEYVLLQQPVTLLDAQEAARLKHAAFKTTSKSRTLEDLITDSVKKIQLYNSVASLKQPSTEISDLKRENKALKEQLRHMSIHSNNSTPRNGDSSFHNNGRQNTGPIICYRCNRAGHTARTYYANLSRPTPNNTITPYN